MKRDATAQRADPEPEAEAVIYLPDLSLPEPAPPKRRPGRRRVADPRSAWLPGTRCLPALRAKLETEAAAAGLSLGGFICVKLGDSSGPRTRHAGLPPADRDILVKLLAELGKIGSNHNQLAHAYNATEAAPGRAEWESQSRAILDMRRALLQALGHAD